MPKTELIQLSPSLTSLVDRGIHRETIEKLGIHHVSRDEATNDKYGFGYDSVSPDGIIVFPISVDGDRTVSVAKNFYASDSSKKNHLEQLNRARRNKGLEPSLKTPKYLLPRGGRACKQVYDPFRILHPKEMDSVLFATEDIIGVIKAAQDGMRIVSSFGVWLVTRQDMEDSELNPVWGHIFKGLFPLYVADSDVYSNPAVIQALIRTGYMVECEVAAFPSQQGKVGLDEYLDSENPLDVIASSGQDIAEFVENYLPRVQEHLKSVEGLKRSQAANKAGSIYLAVIRELSRHVTEISAFKICYQDVLKKIGYGVGDWKPIFYQSRPERSPIESPRLLARALLAQELKNSIAFESKLKAWYLYSEKEKFWEQVQKESVSAAINRAIETVTGESDFETDLLRDTILFVRDEVERREWQSHPTLMNFRNGALDVADQAPIIQPHDARHYLRYCLPRNYVSKPTDTPLINAFLLSLTGDKNDEVEKIKHFIAAILRGLTDLQLFLALIGDPGSGKGTLVNFLIELLGRYAVYATTLESFCGNQFDAGNCYGKRLVVFNDCDQYSGGVSKFLGFTGGDEVRGEIKGGRSFNFKAEGFVVMTANKPVFVRSHPGLARRTVLVKCVKKRSRKADPHLLQKLCGELESFTAKLLKIKIEDIYSTLGSSSSINNPEQALSYWTHVCETDAIAAWADQALSIDDEAKTPVGNRKDNQSELYGSYYEFCHGSGKSAKSFSAFSSDLLTLLKDSFNLPVERLRDRENDKDRSVIQGVSLDQNKGKSIYKYLETITPHHPESSEPSNASGSASPRFDLNHHPGITPTPPDHHPGEISTPEHRGDGLGDRGDAGVMNSKKPGRTQTLSNEGM